MARTRQAKKKRVLVGAKRPASHPRTGEKSRGSPNKGARKSRVKDSRSDNRGSDKTKTKLQSRKALAAVRRIHTPQAINDNQLTLVIRGAVRQELREVLRRALRLFDDSDIGSASDATLPMAAVELQTSDTAALPTNCDDVECDCLVEESVAVEPTANAVSSPEHRSDAATLFNEQSAALESADDRAARMMIERIEAASIVNSPYTQSIVLSFLFDKGAFDTHSAVPTKDLPVKDSRRRKRLISELFEVGALEEVDVIPLRPKHANTRRPSGKRVNSVCLTERAQRGWQLRHATRPNVQP
jgi:hypothetical protein